MRKIFQKWLFILIAFAFTFTFGLSIYLQTQQAKEGAEKQIRLKMNEVMEKISSNEAYLAGTCEVAKEEILVRARVVAKTLQLTPKTIDDADLMNEMAGLLGINQLYVIDTHGTVVAAVPRSFKGRDMNTDPMSVQFSRIMTTPSLEVGLVNGRGRDNDKFNERAAVIRKDGKGVVYICREAAYLKEIFEVANIKNITRNIHLGDDGFLYVSEGNNVVSAEDVNIVGKSLLVTTGIDPKKLQGGQGQFWVKLNQKKHLCMYEKYERFYIIGALPASEIFANRNKTAITLIFLNLLLFGSVFIIVSEMIKRVVINGIESVNTSLRRITEGDLEEKVEVLSNEEFATLSEGINSTVHSLRKAITDAASRIDNELEFARAIQLSAMPNIFPPYPNRNEFDIYAAMYTAKNVGGDFYDFFLIDDNHLAIIIADVSGKGIPASLFMMTSKTVIKNFAESGIPAKEIFTRTNTYLCENNEACMFVTAFLGILEINTGKFTTVSAGHNPPLIMRHDGNDVEWLHSEGGFVLAGIPGGLYAQSEWQLEAGDKVFLYTDGVTEAFNKNGRMFGEDRLKDCLSSNYARNANLFTLLSYIRQEVELFAGEAEQSDDITMLVLEYKKNE